MIFSSAIAKPNIPSKFMSSLQKNTPGILAAFLLCSISIVAWLNRLELSPDSTNYITASSNLVSQGSLFVYANWPSGSLEPEPEPYVQQPPGLILYLAPFISIFKDPILAVALVQCTTIVFLYLALYFATRVLGFGTLLTIGTLLVFTLLRTFEIIFTTFWTETPFIALSLGVGLCAVKIIQGAGTKQTWIAALVLLFLASSVRYNGICNIAWFVPVLFIERRQRLWLTLVVLSASAPIIAWFFRNMVVVGNLSTAYEILASFHPERLLEPFVFIVSRLLSIRWVPQPLFLVALMGIIFFPLFTKKNTQSLIQFAFMCATLAQFVFIWLSALVANVYPLDDRLLSPTIAIGVLMVLNGLHSLNSRFENLKVRLATAAMPFLFIFVSNYVELPNNIQFGKLNYPPEMYLWERLHQIEWISTSTHYYTDWDFNHQIFAGIPQRIIYDRGFIKNHLVALELLAKGNRPFFLFSSNSREKAIIENHIANKELTLEKLEYPDLGFTLYYEAP